MTPISKNGLTCVQKGANLCSERGCDPISGLACDIANFLGELFEQGYQFWSFNASRPAISSVHDQVDGVVVDKHPMIHRLL